MSSLRLCTGRPAQSGLHHSSRTARLPRHAVLCRAYTPQKGEDEGETMLELATYLASRDAMNAPGVYAIYDSDRNLQYVGYGEEIFERMREHAANVPEELRTFVRAKVFVNAAMATSENMAREAEHWIKEEGGVVPPGNGVDLKLWEPSETASSSDADATASGKDVIISPFTQAQVHRSVGQVKGDGLHMTVESVDSALNEVRPYLQGDGGDVEVVKVEGGNVYLRLEGNCSSCSSSSATMSMGIERVLRTTFGDALKEVIEVSEADVGTSVKAVDDLLQLLRPAITNYKGKVEVVSIEDGVCQVYYEGPEPIWVGVRSAIRDKFPDIQDVQRSQTAAV